MAWFERRAVKAVNAAAAELDLYRRIGIMGRLVGKDGKVTAAGEKALAERLEHFTSQERSDVLKAVRGAVQSRRPVVYDFWGNPT